MTQNYIAEYSENFHTTTEVISTYQTSKATDSITHTGMKDLTMKLKAKQAIENEERAEC